MPSPLCDTPDIKSFKCRALVVENDPAWRADHVRNLEKSGYRVVVAEGEGLALLDDAISKASRHRCHLALVDLRLLDDQDPSDTSGFDLVPKLHPAACIIVTAYGDLSKARKAAEDLKVSLVGKEEGPQVLREALLKTITKTYPLKFNPQWPPKCGAEEIIERLAPNNPDESDLWQGVPLDEPDTVIRKLYSSDVKHIQLTRYSAPYGDPGSTTSPRRSVILIAGPQEESGRVWREEILKLAPSDHVKREQNNYDRFVQHHLQQGRTARIEGAAVFWDIGAIRYTDEAIEGRQPFSQWYPEAKIRSVTAALRDLFSSTLGPWYAQPSGLTPDNMYRYYVHSRRQLERGIHRYGNQQPSIDLPGMPRELLNPVWWVRYHAAESNFMSHWDALVHGDLHSDNIFVDQHNKTLVIDYERTGQGYFLCDFVELEKDILLRLMPLSYSQFPLAYHLCELVVSQTDPQRHPRWSEPSGADQRECANLRKAFRAVTVLRELAYQLTHFTGMDEYYWALLMETLISVTRDYSQWENQEAARLAHDRALLLASLICERLSLWGKVRLPHPKQPDTSAVKSVPNNLSPYGTFSHGYALVIGVGSTPAKPTWSLPSTVWDAKAVNQILTDPAACAYLPEHVHTLTDEGASIERIRDRLQWLKIQARNDPEATVIIYFSGHGWRSQDGRYALVPSDVKPWDFEGSVLWSDEFGQAVQEIRPRRLLVLIDSCHAAGMATAKGEEPVLPAGFSKTPPPRPLIESLSQGEGRAVISSCRDDQSSYVRRDRSLSIFTHHLLEALRGAVNLKGETVVRVSNLINHLGKKVPETADREWQARQMPWANYAGEDFPVALLLGGRGVDSEAGRQPGRAEYNISAIRNLLKDALNDQALNELCQDHFPDVYRNLAVSMSVGQKIEALLDYCQRYLAFDSLLQHVRKINAVQFSRYESKIYTK